MSDLVKCSAWDCRHKPKQKCAEIVVYVDPKQSWGTYTINLCSQCLADMMEEIE